MEWALYLAEPIPWLCGLDYNTWLLPGNLCEGGEQEQRPDIGNHAHADLSKGSGFRDPRDRRYLGMGATLVAVGRDLGLFRSSTQALCGKFRK